MDNDLPIPMKYKPKTFKEIPRINDIANVCGLRKNGDFYIIHGARNTGKSLIISLIETINDNTLVIDGSDDNGSKAEARLRVFAQTPIEITLLIDDIDRVNDKIVGIVCNFCDLYRHKLAIYATCTNLAGLSQRFKARFIPVVIDPITNDILTTIAANTFSKEKIEISTDSIEYIVARSACCIPLLLCNIEKVKLLENYDYEFWRRNDIFSESDKSQAMNIIDLCEDGDYANALKAIKTARNNGFTLLDILHILSNNLHQPQSYTKPGFIEVSKLILSMIVDVSNGGAETSSIHEYELVNKLIKALRQTR